MSTQYTEYKVWKQSRDKLPRGSPKGQTNLEQNDVVEWNQFPASSKTGIEIKITSKCPSALKAVRATGDKKLYGIIGGLISGGNTTTGLVP